MEWKPIADAPKDGAKVWAIDEDEVIFRIRWFTGDDGLSCWVDDFYAEAENITHVCWLSEIPLPGAQELADHWHELNWRTVVRRQSP